MTIETCRQKLRRWQSLVDRKIGARDQLQERLAAAQSTLDETELQLIHKREAQELLKVIEEETQKEWEADLVEVTSEGLTLVFQKKTELVLESRFLRDQSAVDIDVRQKGLRTGLVGERGGGLINVVSFLLRIPTIVNAQPEMSLTLLLDEPFAEVSQEYVTGVAMLLRKICDETGVQIIMVTHEPGLAEHADYLYQIGQNEKGISSVTLLSSGADIHVYDEEEEASGEAEVEDRSGRRRHRHEAGDDSRSKRRSVQEPRHTPTQAKVKRKGR